MLLGKSKHNLDAKYRVIMPSKFREEIGDSFVVAKGYGPCLAVYSQEEYKKLALKVMALPANLPETQVIRREILGEAENCTADKQGRFVVPTELREKVGITREVMIIGNGDHAEIWDMNEWMEYMYGKKSMSYEQAAASLLEKGWTF